MVNSEFEKLMLEHISSIEKELSRNTEKTTNVENYLTELKKGVADLCNRMTVLETQRDEKIKAHDNYIKILGILFGSSGIGSLLALLGTFHVFH